MNHFSGEAAGRAPVEIAGAILAGGQSKRMGESKANVAMPDGRSMIEWVAAALSGITSRLVIVGPCAGFDPRRISRAVLIEDKQPHQGPLSGLETLLSSGLAQSYLVAAC